METRKQTSRPISRRNLLRRGAVLAGALSMMTGLLEACGQAAAPAPTPAPAKPAAEPTKPAAAAPAPTQAAAAPAAAAPAKLKPGTIQYWSWLNPADTNPRAAVQSKLIAAFEQKNPGLKVDVQVVDWRTIPQQLLQATAAGKGPDVVRVYNPSLAELDAGKSILALNDYADKWPQQVKDDLVGGYEEKKIKGKFLAMFIENRVYMLWYRKDLAEKAGYTMPFFGQGIGADTSAKNPLRTWDELTEEAKKVQTDRITGIQLSLAKSTPLTLYNNLLPVLLAMGSGLVDDKAKALFHEEPGQRWFQWIQDQVHVHKTMPASQVSIDHDANYQALLSGTTAHYFDGGNRLADARKSAKDVGQYFFTTPLPSLDAGKPCPVVPTGWMLAMSKDVKDKDATWAFIEHMTSTESMIQNAKEASEMPARRSALKDAWFDSDAGKEMRAWAEYAAKYKAIDHSAALVQATRLQDILVTGAQEIVANKADVKKTLADAATKWNAVAG